jgi:hypothetical protein
VALGVRIDGQKEVLGCFGSNRRKGPNSGCG